MRHDGASPGQTPPLCRWAHAAMGGGFAMPCLARVVGAVPEYPIHRCVAVPSGSGPVAVSDGHRRLGSSDAWLVPLGGQPQ